MQDGAVRPSFSESPEAAMSAPILHGEKRASAWPSLRALGWAGFYGAVLAAWVAVALLAPDAAGNGHGALSARAVSAFGLSADDARPLALWAMWALMTVAMMLPTFVPALRTFVDLSAAGAATGPGTAALVAGYLAIWLGASALGAAAQAGLARAGLVTHLGASVSPWLTAALLTGAGLYQFSALKGACLSRCRMPMTFFMQHWRPGAPAAAAMGLRLGALCLGCCWALMALGFVGGTMNLIWMGAATVFMTMEKLPAIGRRLTRPAGWALIFAGAAMALRATAIV